VGFFILDHMRILQNDLNKNKSSDLPSILCQTNAIARIALCVGFATCLFLNGCLKPALAQSVQIDLSAIQKIESSSGKNLYGDWNGKEYLALGAFQIQKPLVTDYNARHKVKFSHADMLDTSKAEIVAAWAFQTYYPKILKHIKKDVTTESLLSCWNAGCRNNAKKYITKYNKITRGNL
jgi:hypothetical protein